MKLTAKTDIEVPAAFAYTVLTDFPAWEREGLQRGVEIEQSPGSANYAVAAIWKVKALFRGRQRKIAIRIDELARDQRLRLHIEGPTVECDTKIEVIVLSPRRSRLRLDLDLKPKSLAARLFLNTMRLAKGRVQVKLETRLAQLGARIQESHTQHRA